MAQDRFPEASCGEWEKYGWYGFNGNDVGDRAIGVLAGLFEPIPRTLWRDDKLIVWSSDDFRTFEDMCELETGLKFIEEAPDPYVDGGEIANLWRAFGRFHVALPLSEAERLWLFDPLDKKLPKERNADIHKPETLLGFAEEITSGGVKQVIQGREVVRRLGAWRREQDEFVGQDTLDEAREALGTIATTLVIDANWPREHLDLRAILQADD